MVAVLRAKTGAERLEVAFGLWEMSREVLLCAERHRHPDLDDDQLSRRVSERLLHAPF